MSSAVSLLLTACRDNARLATHFWQSAPLRVPVLLLWVAVFGGALHAPVTTFFYISVGASSEQIGNIGAIISAVSMLTAPAYGSIADRYTAHPAIAAAGFCCAFGCAIRALAPNVGWLYAGSCVLGLGAASLQPSVLAHVSMHTDVGKRASVVGALAFQMSTLRLAGKSLYAPSAASLAALGFGLEWQYRVMMGACPFFCIFGWCALAVCGRAVRTTAASRAQRSAHPPNAAAKDVAAPLSYHADADDGAAAP
eukprot:1106364-Prymnesium_polylepis.1